jgi:hypothetical protein
MFASGRATCATVEAVSGDQTPTPKQLAEAHDRARQLGLTIRGRKNFVLDDGKEREPCGDFSGLMFKIAWREAVERGEATYVLSPCGSHGTVFVHDKEDTNFFIERQDDGELAIGEDRYKKTWGSKTDLETGERIQFVILEDGTQQETRRFPKEDDDDEITNAAGEKTADELPKLAARIHDEHQAATSALRQGVLHAIAAGDLLLEAKARLKHGGWLDWLKANCEIPERTVQAYMRLARLPVEKRNAVADLPLREALLAIRSRQERLERPQAENRPPLIGKDTVRGARGADAPPNIDGKQYPAQRASKESDNIVNRAMIRPLKEFDPGNTDDEFVGRQFLSIASDIVESGADTIEHLSKNRMHDTMLVEALKLTEQVLEQWSGIRSLLLDWRSGGADRGCDCNAPEDEELPA